MHGIDAYVYSLCHDLIFAGQCIKNIADFMFKILKIFVSVILKNTFENALLVYDNSLECIMNAFYSFTYNFIYCV